MMFSAMWSIMNMYPNPIEQLTDWARELRSVDMVRARALEDLIDSMEHFVEKEVERESAKWVKEHEQSALWALHEIRKQDVPLPADIEKTVEEVLDFLGD